MSGAFTAQTRVVILSRDQCCVACGSSWELTIQHRRARGMGGSKDPATRSPANGLALCGSGTTGCHGWTEANPAQATFLGWRVNQWGNPTLVPVWRHSSDYGPHWALLADDGSWSRPTTHPSEVLASEMVEQMLSRRTA